MEKLSPQESEKPSPQESEKLSPQESEKLSPHADPPSSFMSWRGPCKKRRGAMSESYDN